MLTFSILLRYWDLGQGGQMFLRILVPRTRRAAAMDGVDGEYVFQVFQGDCNLDGAFIREVLQRRDWPRRRLARQCRCGTCVVWRTCVVWPPNDLDVIAIATRIAGVGGCVGPLVSLHPMTQVVAIQQVFHES